MWEFPDTPLQRLLANQGACATARGWVDNRTLETAWAACDERDWMRFFAEHTKRVWCTCGEQDVSKCPLGKAYECVSNDALRDYLGTPHLNEETLEVTWSGGTIES